LNKFVEKRFGQHELYQVTTKRLNEAVRRNLGRFPEDFMFQLTDDEASALRSQIATLETGRGRYSKWCSNSAKRSRDRVSVCCGLWLWFSHQFRLD